MLRYHKISKKRQAILAQPLFHALSQAHPFLDVIRDACARGGRYTLVAEAEGQTYTVLVDRGGPFNASGAGLIGSAALIRAAGLRNGTYTVTDGWPVEQPHYQVGLDVTLTGLTVGAVDVAPGALPPPRGVAALRNAAWQTTRPGLAPAVARPRAAEPAPTTVPEAPAPPSPAAPAPVPALIPPPAPRPLAPLADAMPLVERPAPEPPALPWVPGAPSFAAPPAPAPVPPAPRTPPAQFSPPLSAAQAPPPEAISEAPTASPAPNPGAASAGAGLRDALSPIISAGPAPLVPGNPTTSIDQGALKHLLTQALLWVVQIDEPECYNLSQAWRLSTRAVANSVEFLIPFHRYVLKERDRIRDDWRKSGETAERERRRSARRP